MRFAASQSRLFPTANSLAKRSSHQHMLPIFIRTQFSVVIWQIAKAHKTEQEKAYKNLKQRKQQTNRQRESVLVSQIKDCCQYGMYTNNFCHIGICKQNFINSLFLNCFVKNVLAYFLLLFLLLSWHQLAKSVVAVMQ